MKTHKDLEVWKKSMDFVSLIYDITSSFPESEKFGLANQIRRASVSIPSNIAEGASRQHNKEFIQFLYVAFGSLNEVETQYTIALNLGFIDKEAYSKLEEFKSDIGKMLSGLIKYQKTKTNQS